YTPIGSESDYVGILPVEFQLVPQRGEGFGERLACAAQDLLRCGFSSVCLIDSDSPTVSSDAFRQAIKFLHESGDRVVLGPSDDGGYYLIGLKRNHREVFEEIDWSTDRVFDQTRKRALASNLEIALLLPGYDIDDPATLRRLCDELLSNQTDPRIAPATRKYLAELTANRRF
ncbi:MAG TPA: DUF2064 domain-containing protein, partial [Chthoniobacterales bacterium]|nr:DUF2064 domain-containing protein [Chthoniobacterales bacterium]